MGWDEDTILKHSYENPGSYDVTGRIFKINDEGIPCGWHKFNVRFNVGRNVNSGNEFTQVGGSGFTFLPYKETIPIIGGLSEKSIYYKTVKRQLGYIGDSLTPFKLNFAYHSDRLASEYALAAIDENYIGSEISAFTGSFAYDGLTDSEISDNLVIYKYPGEQPITVPNTLYSGFFSGSVDGNGIIQGTPILINGGDYKQYGELGDHLGDSDVSQVRFLSTTASMTHMLGFSEVEAGNPGDEKYWKNIVPKDYAISNRNGIYYYGDEIPESMTGSYNQESTCPKPICVDENDNQNWTGTNEYGNTYYYPVLPKLNQKGKFDNELGLQGNKSPYGSKTEWDEVDSESPVTNMSYRHSSLEMDLDFSSISNDTFDDKSGNAFKGIIIGDYRMEFEDKTRKPMRDDVINKPSKNSEDKAF